MPARSTAVSAFAVKWSGRGGAPCRPLSLLAPLITFRARRKHVRGNDLGFVGEICYAEPCWIEALWQQGGIPVLASLALGADGEYYNVNADEMAAACAAACHAKVRAKTPFD